MSEWSRDETTIRTPDQRLRVFVSSTLGELSEERQAVARAIAALRLTPVMFELGARPHPPQEVYRAYIAQSDVFIGLYWQRYGWVGPGLEISGLEDELERSRALPRLLYIKAPAPDREPRLTEMLARVKDEAANSYRTFHTPRELSRLVRDDLATLLSERFTMVTSIADRVPRSPPVGARGPRPLPVCTTPLVGREEAVDEVTGLLGQAGGRLLTLTGPGGIGKTRLALAAAERLRDSYRAGVVFVPLVGVTRSERALVDIGRAVGADLAGAGASLEALVDQFGDEPWLLVLDNLEQVVGAAGELGEVLARCPALAILATSRTVLGLRAEREYPVPPLPLPVDPTTGRMEELAASPAVALFVDRARALHHGFVLTDENVRAVVEICRRLEGVPLAIELAAARTRLLEPDVLLGRLTTSLDALGTGMVDLARTAANPAGHGRVERRPAQRRRAVAVGDHDCLPGRLDRRGRRPRGGPRPGPGAGPDRGAAPAQPDPARPDRARPPDADVGNRPRVRRGADGRAAGRRRGSPPARWLLPGHDRARGSAAAKYRAARVARTAGS
jgi:hypothetical protein